MEKLKRVVSEIAYSHDFSKLSLLHRSLVPFLSFASSIYNLSLTTRHYLYFLGIFRKHRLPVPVISVGNLTWGGNGKTPMVEFLSCWFNNSGISPLILSRGYAGGDEVKMLERHLMGTSVKVGVGANRAATASWFLDRYGYINSCTNAFFEKLLSVNKVDTDATSDKIGAAILDDGMQHVRLERDLDVVMVNGLTPWGNNQLIPFGPLREPLSALARADIVVIHHADLVPEPILMNLKRRIQDIKESLPVFFSRMVSSHFFTVHNVDTKLPLSAVHSRVVLCLSAIGSPNGFVKCVEKLGPLHVDQLHYSDHYMLQPTDICLMRRKLEELCHSFGSRPIVVTTEKDYDRDREILSQLCPFDVLVLCSQLQIVPHNGSSEKRFKELLKQLLDSRSR
ncbi:probable tetraacyldisaccharide 4'-kinase, mitochondrial isoform X2 [Beta vulgaris subsp. vulgaris]|uniref:probable tetraacyldisaccharide 4'-kinase, mitochondrial isoform X2 n=1 Tax=Beta vulgaris subsp. vulgaris TaxID=3555 RepID=UPI000540217E|nr:probable tetraacyldisaccharide 4'-kinase, mitochondrial isoform X2 [Beta vulgaris subsp. vulgaris]